MRRLIAAAGATLLLIALPLYTASAGQAIRVSPGLATAGAFPQAHVQFPGGITALPDIEYAHPAGYRPLLLDLYREKASPKAAPKPLVVYIHGGHWAGGSSRTLGAFADFPRVLALLAQRGYIVAAINYRLIGEARFPAQLQDVSTAIAFLRAHAAQYGIDPSRVILWGGSAGGHLAALAATNCGKAASEPAGESVTEKTSPSEAGSGDDACVRGAVIWYGIFDFRPLLTIEKGLAVQKALISKFLGCNLDACPDAVAQLSPITQVSQFTPPMLLIHGADDNEVPMQQTQTMADQMRGQGASVETDFIPGVGHELVGKTVAMTREASLAALRRTFQFIDEIAVPARTAGDTPARKRIVTSR